MRFQSKIGHWIAGLLIIAPLLSLLLALFGLASGRAAMGGLALANLGLCCMIYAGLLLPLHYTLREEGLQVRHGWLGCSVPYEEILGVTPSRSPISAPALSLGRLKVSRVGRPPLLISPLERERFLHELVHRTPQLKRFGDQLVVRASWDYDTETD